MSVFNFVLCKINKKDRLCVFPTKQIFLTFFLDFRYIVKNIHLNYNDFCKEEDEVGT